MSDVEEIMKLARACEYDAADPRGTADSQSTCRDALRAAIERIVDSRENWKHHADATEVRLQEVTRERERLVKERDADIERAIQPAADLAAAMKQRAELAEADLKWWKDAADAYADERDAPAGRERGAQAEVRVQRERLSPSSVTEGRRR